jgi:hypothetical protein
MKEPLLTILHYIFSKTATGGFIPLYDLEVEFALSGSQLRAILEDLMEAELVVEAPEGFRVSPGGVSFGRSRWT